MMGSWPWFELGKSQSLGSLHDVSSIVCSFSFPTSTTHFKWKLGRSISKWGIRTKALSTRPCLLSLGSFQQSSNQCRLGQFLQGRDASDGAGRGWQVSGRKPSRHLLPELGIDPGPSTWSQFMMFAEARIQSFGMLTVAHVNGRVLARGVKGMTPKAQPLLQSKAPAPGSWVARVTGW